MGWMGRLGKLVEAHSGHASQWTQSPSQPRDRLAGACPHCCRREGLSICSCIVASESGEEGFLWQRHSQEPGHQCQGLLWKERATWSTHTTKERIPPLRRCKLDAWKQASPQKAKQNKTKQKMWQWILCQKTWNKS